jgi:hypothetical protein
MINSGQQVKAQSQIGNMPLPSAAYHRLPVESGSFASWLRHLPLKDQGVPVLDYRGRVFKTAGDSVVARVVDIDITGSRLEQCMDIIVRFYADYLWENNKTNGLSLPLPGGYRLDWDDWKQGLRPFFKGLDMSLKNNSTPDSSEKSYRNYLNIVYAESHTQQFYHAYEQRNKMDVEIGDFIVKKGTKGHAILIVDMAEDERGERIVLIGNGDTPACQFFLLNFKNHQPWVPLSFDKENLNLPLKRKMTWDGLRRFD